MLFYFLFLRSQRNEYRNGLGWNTPTTTTTTTPAENRIFGLFISLKFS